MIKYSLLSLIPVFLAYSRSLPKSPIKEHLNGLIQHFYCSAQIALGFWIHAYLGIFLACIIHSFLVIDLFLYRRMQLRMQWSFCEFFRTPRLFISSAAKMKCGRYFLLLLSIWIFDFSLIHYNGSWLPIVIFLLPAYLTCKKSKNSSLQNAWVMCQFQQREKKEATPTFLLPKTEIYTKISDSYPLLRKTRGFKGKKLWDLSLSPNEQPNILFLLLESFSARDIGMMGSPLSATPHFDRLAKEGIFFSSFYANDLLTTKAFISTLFGVPAKFYSSSSYFLDFPYYGLPQILKEKGYENSFIHNGDLSFQRRMQFFKHHEFDHLFGRSDIQKSYPEAASISWGVHDEYLLRFAADYLEKQRKPSFSTILTLSAHHPWHYPLHFSHKNFHQKEPYEQYLRSLSYTDYSLGLFVDLLKTKGLSENTLLFILADHAQPMGEHQSNTVVQKYLYEENIHIPLLIWAGNRISKPKIIDTPASQLDLLPTLLDMLQISANNHSMGSSLLREDKEKIVYFHNSIETTGHFGARMGKNKYIYTPSTNNEQFYDLSSDPKEKKNLHAPAFFKEKVCQYEAALQWLYENKRFSPNNKQCSLTIQKSQSEEEVCKDLQKGFAFLDLSKSSLTDSIMEELCKQGKKILSLSFSHNLRLTDKKLKKVAKACPNLIHLNLSHCSLLTNLQPIWTHCKKLEELSLQALTNITWKIPHKIVRLDLRDTHLQDSEIEQIAHYLPLLQTLKLSCSAISSQGLLSLKFTKLEELELYDCNEITDQPLIQFLEKNPIFKNLILENCPKVTDNLLLQLPGKNIRKLWLFGAKEITDQGIAALHNTSLQYFSITENNKITDAGLELFSEKEGMTLFIRDCPNISKSIIKKLQEKHTLYFC